MWYRRVQTADSRWWSHLQRVIEEKMPARVRVDSLMSLFKNHGVSAEELSWHDFGAFFKDRPIVSKSELLKFVERNTPYIERHLMDYEAEQSDYEEELGNVNDHLGHEEHTLSGGTNYREYLLKLGANPSDLTDEKFLEWLDSKGNVYKAMVSKSPAIMQNAWRSYAKYVLKAPNRHETDHFPFHDGIVAHLRMHDRSGPNNEKLLHIEELQSDWHQEGRKHGYYSKEVGDLWRRRTYLNNTYPSGENLTWISPEQRAKIIAQQEQYKAELQAIDARLAELNVGKLAVPQGPYQKSWHELGLRHALELAAEGGYDGLTWSQGEDVAKIMGVTKVVDTLKVTMLDESNVGLLGYQGSKGVVNTTIPREKLGQYIGEGLAMKCHDLGVGESRVFDEAEMIEVGGHGMRQYYNHILPAYMNKYTKKWQARVNPIEIDVAKPTHYVTYNRYKKDDKPWSVRGFDPRSVQSDFATEEEAEAFVKSLAKPEYSQAHGVIFTPEMRQEILERGQRIASV